MVPTVLGIRRFANLWFAEGLERTTNDSFLLRLTQGTLPEASRESQRGARIFKGGLEYLVSRASHLCSCRPGRTAS